MALTREEQECIFHLAADNRETIHVFADDPVWMRKLESAGAIFVKTTGEGKEYTIEYRQLSIRKAGKKVMSEENKVRARERMREMGMKSTGRRKKDVS